MSGPGARIRSVESFTNEWVGFVRVHTGGARPMFISFLSADAPLPENHGIIAQLAQKNPQRAERVRARVNDLIAHNHAFFVWLERTPENSGLFARDPVAALRKALPDLPADFFDWGN